MKFELKRVDVWSATKISFFLNGFLGLIFGLFYALILAMVGSIIEPISGGEIESLGALTGAFGIFFAIILAIFSAVTGGITVAILAWIYNIFARWIGGIEMDLAGGKIEPLSSVEREEGLSRYE
ncbi:MAG: hypothetical protein AMJ90_10000 [candidate division Zixibacteria bacterium SM23_73_2]|nr:MAG: hypothetical protein AMJ90_10000 [candidate division Zixibacteria bacterium SM23_73_2]